MCCSTYFCVLCIVCFVTFSVLFVCICVLNNCHRVATQLQLDIYHIKKLNFLDRLSKHNQIQNFMQIRPMEAQLCHADGYDKKKFYYYYYYYYYCDRA
jgi:hypothetical protein